MINGIGQQLDGHLPLLRPATGADGRVVADAADTDPLVLQGAENTQGDLKEVNPCAQSTPACHCPDFSQALMAPLLATS